MSPVLLSFLASLKKPNKDSLKCEPDTQTLPNLELILQYLAFFWFLKDHFAPGVVRMKAK